MREPKIVFWDLETLHDPEKVMKSSTLFSIGNWPGRTLSPDLGSIISFGYKIYGQDKAGCINAWDFDNWNEDVNDDSAVCMLAYEILKDADVIVTHNGKKYDMPYLNNRLMKHGFPPLHKIKHVDTKVVAKRIKPYSASLGHLADELKLTELKMSTGGASLWDQVRQRNKAAQKKMSDYCKQDVETLEALYLYFRPLLLASETANYHHYYPEDVHTCPKCGSENLGKNGRRRVKKGFQQRYSCNNCGGTHYINLWGKANLKVEGV